eukprot:1156198-Pelagomonas_calceolata.AAC.2
MHTHARTHHLWPPLVPGGSAAAAPEPPTAAPQEPGKAQQAGRQAEKTQKYVGYKKAQQAVRQAGRQMASSRRECCALGALMVLEVECWHS